MIIVRGLKIRLNPPSKSTNWVVLVQQGPTPKVKLIIGTLRGRVEPYTVQSIPHVPLWDGVWQLPPLKFMLSSSGPQSQSNPELNPEPILRDVLDLDPPHSQGQSTDTICNDQGKTLV